MAIDRSSPTPLRHAAPGARAIGRPIADAAWRLPFLREPLLHFVAAGVALFVLHAWWSPEEPEPDDGAVRLTADETRWLVATWSRRWRRPPDEHELSGLIADHLREQLLAREARALALDEDDAVITSRLAQKMEFLIEDTASLGEPTDDVLRRLYAERADEWRTPARVAFTQIFFKTEAAARQALSHLATADIDRLGEPSSLGRDYALTDLPAIESLFGFDFAAELESLATDQWQGPVASPYGFHLVNVDEWRAAEPLPFEEVRPRLVDVWRRAEQDRVNELMFRRLLEKYRVVVDEDVYALLDPKLAALTVGAE
jgi:hypothetical protein